MTSRKQPSRQAKRNTAESTRPKSSRSRLGQDLLTTEDRVIRSRELFSSDATSVKTVTKLKGKCTVIPPDVLEKHGKFIPDENTFFQVLHYCPQNKRLATTQGEIRVGASHQARLPEFQGHVSKEEMSPLDSSHLETLEWEPLHLADSDLMMYIRAARSIAAFTGMCDGGSDANNGTHAASTDETTINALGTLHGCRYDPGQALSCLVKTPALRTIHKKWSEEEAKKFVKGIRMYGKNFFRIRKELLPTKETGDLVEYYYFWKKTPGALQNRHHRRRSRAGHKRQTTRSARDQQDEESGSASEESEGNDSEDSDPDKELTTVNNCDNCKTASESLRLHNVEGKEPSLRCGPCLLYVKRHGEERPLTPSTHPPYLFQPVQDEEESPTPRHNMRTRRGNTTGSKGKKKETGSSPEGREESPVNGTHRNSTGRKSPSTNSCSSSSDKDSPQKKSKNNKENSRAVKRKSNVEKEDKPKKKKDQERSDSESCSESGSLSGNDEGNEGDLDENNQVSLTEQDDLSSSSPAASPSLSVDSENFKPIKSEAVTVVEAPHLQPPPPLTQIPLEATPAPGQLPPIPSTLPLHPSVAAEARPCSRSSSPTLAPAPVPTKTGDEGEPKPQPPPPPPPLASIPGPFHLPGGFPPGAGLFGVPTSSGVPPPPGLVPIKREPMSPKSAASTGNAPRWEDVVKKEVESQVPLPPRSPQDTKPAASQSAGQSEERAVPDIPPMAAMPIPASMPLVKSEEGGMMVPPHPGVASFPPLLGMAGLFPSSAEPPPPLTSNPPRPTATMSGEGAGEPGKTAEEKIEVESESEEEDDREGSMTPGLTPTPCSKEAHKSQNAVLMKILDRGPRNTCSRCDLIFKPLPDSKFAKKREERERKSSSSASHPSVKEEKPQKRAAESPPSRPSMESGSIPSSSQSSSSFMERHTPRPNYTDTPALRQLSDIARPHNLGEDILSVYPTADLATLPFSMYAGQDYGRHIPPGYLMGPIPGMDPLMSGYRMPIVPSVRDRLELDLEREKRERDARERELRDRELREIELRKEMEMKPPGMGASKPGLDGRPLLPGSNLDPHWLEVQRRFGYAGGQLVPTPGSSATASGGHIPGVYPPASIASDLMQRERDKLERMGHPAATSLERMSAEQRIQAERLALVDPMYRYQLAASLGTSGVTHAHTHTHAHAHTHLHLHSQQQQQQAAAAAQDPTGPPPPPPLLSGAFHPLLPTHPHVLGPHYIPGADPLAGLPSGAGAPPTLSGLSSSLAHSLPGHPSLLASASPREQELLQRELYARAYMDQNLAHQLSSQAAAHHEALQRQLALERERFGPSGHLPPH